MNCELLTQLGLLVERLNEWRGTMVEVIEQITHSPGNLNRHHTTYSSFVMRLEFVGVAFSGASLMVLGKALGRDVGYQASCDFLERLSVEPGEIAFVERFAKVAEWHTAIKQLNTSQGAEPDAAPAA